MLGSGTMQWTITTRSLSIQRSLLSLIWGGRSQGDIVAKWKLVNVPMTSCVILSVRPGGGYARSK